MRHGQSRFVDRAHRPRRRLRRVPSPLPGVLIGGQIGPHLQGKVKQRDMEIAIGILFAVIGLAMGYVVYQENA